MTNRNYKVAFLVALVISIGLAAALVWQMRKAQHAGAAGRTAAEPAMSEMATPTAPASPASVQPQLNPVQLTPERMQMIGVKLQKAEFQQVTDEIRATGTVEVDESRVAYVQTRFPGWLRKVYGDRTYQLVRKGEPLFTIYSPELVATEQEYLLAKKNSESMQASSVSGVSAGAQSLLGAARQRLEQWEVPASEIEKLEATGKPITDLTFNSPVSGYITERNALPNMYVQPETKLYTVADLSTVWVYAQVFQDDLGKIKPGDPASVTVDAYPGRTFNGQVSQILPQVDMNTRTARVRLVFANPGMKLTPGMYVNATLKLPLGRKLVVPSSAVLHAGTRQVVFVSRGEGTFDPRPVETGAQVGDKTVIAKGLAGGETVVSSANFLIDSESQLQAAAGSFTPPPPGAGGPAAAASHAAPQAKIELTTQPDPPHKGDNVFRVKLSSKDGTPISGAKVTVIFYMAAMPSMGMAAMKTTVDLADKGSGNYEGQGNLGSGGTWQVTLTAEKDGQRIAQRRLNVTAEGGM
ncbi:MAG TPA: FixH family protein [Terriglobales bacterium]|nr:FixH family protein [Terriglobales bacterium]